jgi:hypothetical protein
LSGAGGLLKLKYEAAHDDDPRGDAVCLAQS